MSDTRRLWRRRRRRSAAAPRDRDGPRCSAPRGSGRSSARAPTQCIGTPDADLSRAELREKTGCVDRRPRRLDRGLARRGLRRHGPVRLGQVDARAHADPADRADRGHDRDRRPRRDGGGRRPSCASCAGTPSRWCSSTSACSRTGRVIDNVAFGLEIQGVPKPQRLAQASEVLAARRARGRRQLSSPTSSRAGCSSASAWRAPSRSTRS